MLYCTVPGYFAEPNSELLIFIYNVRPIISTVHHCISVPYGVVQYTTEPYCTCTVHAGKLPSLHVSTVFLNPSSRQAKRTMIDALLFSGVFSYWAFSSTPPIRNAFACCAAVILLTEALFFRAGASRAVVIIGAIAALYFPLSTSLILRPYSSYFLMTQASNIGLELLVAAVLLTIVCSAIVVPLRRRRIQRQIIYPIRSVSPQTSHVTPRVALVPSTSIPANTRTSTHSSAGASESKKQSRRSAITRSHVLASRMYNQDLQRRDKYLPQNLQTEREERRINERQALIQEAKEKVCEARGQLSKALDELRTAHRLAEFAVATRDEHVRNLDENIDPNSYDEETEHLFAEARKAEQRKAEALSNVTAAQAVLSDVERWASEL